MLAQKQGCSRCKRSSESNADEYIERKRFLTEEEVSKPLEEEEEEEEDGDDDEEEKIIRDADTSVELSDELKFILELKNIWKTRVHYPQLSNRRMEVVPWTPLPKSFSSFDEEDEKLSQIVENNSDKITVTVDENDEEKMEL
ncbi:hypothetical protein T02_743 [Trichinella nativa]|uniref:Uncharacterized protein n=1 Tax=Trichinella nativa TaxID=6335 RepID=A0A0V1LS27_9BILA|nr:hypothetical protein T02_743 [Trichinella nativa]